MELSVTSPQDKIRKKIRVLIVWFGESICEIRNKDISKLLAHLVYCIQDPETSAVPTNIALRNKQRQKTIGTVLRSYSIVNLTDDSDPRGIFGWTRWCG